MHYQVAKMVGQGFALARRFGRHGRERDHDVTEQYRRRTGNGLSVFGIHPQRDGVGAGKRQYVGRPVPPAVVAVEGTYRPIVGQENTDFKVARGPATSLVRGTELSKVQRGHRGPSA